MSADSDAGHLSHVVAIASTASASVSVAPKALPPVRTAAVILEPPIRDTIPAATPTRAADRIATENVRMITAEVAGDWFIEPLLHPGAKPMGGI
jgi:hypothetical protein